MKNENTFTPVFNDILPGKLYDPRMRDTRNRGELQETH
jgi:hypothetical protein